MTGICLFHLCDSDVGLEGDLPRFERFLRSDDFQTRYCMLHTLIESLSSTSEKVSTERPFLANQLCLCA